jgi:hypothetical protein
MAARAEYDAEFRTDVAAFLDLAVVEAAVDHDVTVRRPVRGVRYRSAATRAEARATASRLLSRTTRTGSRSWTEMSVRNSAPYSSRPAAGSLSIS